VERTTFDDNDVIVDMPDIRGISTDPELLIKCVNVWRMSGFSGVPPDPYDVAMMNTAQQEVVIMANYIDFVRDEPKRAGMSSAAFSLKDLH
jgi:hypothetical protein